MRKTRSLLVVAMAAALCLSLASGGVVAADATTTTTDAPDDETETADDGNESTADENETELDDNETALDGNETDLDGNQTDENLSAENGSDGFGLMVSSFVASLVGNDTGANATDGPLGYFVANFVLANNPGNAPDHAGPPAHVVNGTNETANESDRGPPEGVGPASEDERGQPDHAGPDGERERGGGPAAADGSDDDRRGGGPPADR